MRGKKRGGGGWRTFCLKREKSIARMRAAANRVLKSSPPTAAPAKTRAQAQDKAQTARCIKPRPELLRVLLLLPLLLQASAAAAAPPPSAACGVATQQAATQLLFGSYRESNACVRVLGVHVHCVSQPIKID